MLQHLWEGWTYYGVFRRPTCGWTKPLAGRLNLKSKRYVIPYNMTVQHDMIMYHVPCPCSAPFAEQQPGSSLFPAARSGRPRVGACYIEMSTKRKVSRDSCHACHRHRYSSARGRALSVVKDEREAFLALIVAHPVHAPPIDLRDLRAAWRARG